MYELLAPESNNISTSQLCTSPGKYNIELEGILACLILEKSNTQLLFFYYQIFLDFFLFSRTYLLAVVVLPPCVVQFTGALECPGSSSFLTHQLTKRCPPVFLATIDDSSSSYQHNVPFASIENTWSLRYLLLNSFQNFLATWKISNVPTATYPVPWVPVVTTGYEVYSCSTTQRSWLYYLSESYFCRTALLPTLELCEMLHRDFKLPPIIIFLLNLLLIHE